VPGIWSGSAASITSIDLEHRQAIGHREVFNLFASNSAVIYHVSDRYVWLSGLATGTENTLIVRYNPATYEHVEISLGAGFELARFEPVGNDRVLFEGVRYNPLGNVVAQMDLEGNVLEESVFDLADLPILTLLAILPADFIRIDGSPQDWSTDLRVLSGSADTGPEGSDLLHYSQTQGRGEYLGLVEFVGTISPAHNTRVRFDTHELIITPRSIGVRTTDDLEAELTGLSANSALAFGSALEFAIPSSALGTSLPDLQFVERFELVLHGAVAEANAEWVTLENDERELHLELTLGSALGDQEIEVILGEKTRVLITASTATLVQTGEANIDLTGQVEWPEVFGSDAEITVLIHEDFFIDLQDLSDEQSFTPELANPDGVEREVSLDKLS
jgi:hypothetical protein